MHFYVELLLGIQLHIFLPGVLTAPSLPSLDLAMDLLYTNVQSINPLLFYVVSPAPLIIRIVAFPVSHFGPSACRQNACRHILE